MQRVKGRLSSLEDLIIFVDRLKETGGYLELYFPFFNEEVTICYDGINFYISTSIADFPEKKALKVFIERWLLSDISPEFEFIEGEECSSGVPVLEDELLQVIKDPFLEMVKELPPYFEITKIDVKKVPSFLVAHWTARRPVNREEVYKYGLTLSDILRYIEAGLLEVKPFTVVESFPYKLRLFIQALALLVVIYFALPLGYLKFNQFKLPQAVNWGLRERIVRGSLREKLPVKGCLRTDFYLVGDRVINPGIDGTPGTGDDISVKLPDRGYKPVFALPVK